MLDRLQIRRHIGSAAARLAAAESRYCAIQDGELKLLHQAWRDLTNAAIEARKSFEAAVIRHRRTAGSREDREIIANARLAYPNLLGSEIDGEWRPTVCIATGLAVFEGDRIVGDPETGFVVLRPAIRPVRGIREMKLAATG